MSLQQAKILLNKINTLYNSVEIDGQVSSIERDLMLSYVRQFYETFLSTEEATAPVVVPIPEVKPKPIEVVVVPPPVPTAAPVFVELEIETPPPPPKPAPVVIAPIEIPTPQPVVVEVPRPAPPPPPVEVPKPLPQTVFPEPPKPKAAQKPLIKPANERVDQSELFEEKMKKELSDKLGEMPIDDIRKAMGLNEKIIFLNDLFDSNQHEFDAAVNTLNSVGNYDAAKNHLALLASRFDWASKEKQAKPFIRLVKRRYNN